MIAIGATGAASFSGSLFAGRYDLWFETAANPGLVGLPAAAKIRLASAVALTGDRRLSYDLSLVAVSGTITAAGAPLPDSPGLSSRGNVVFRERASGDVRSFPVGATGPGSFSGSVAAGTYDVSFETVSGAALVGLPIAARTRVDSGLVLPGSGSPPLVRSYDLRPVSVTGNLTVGGAPLPESPTLATRGSLIYRDPQTGDARSFAIPATAAASYSGLMFAGSYDVWFQTAPGIGLVGLPAASTTRLVHALAVGAATGGDFDLAVASVSGAVTLAGAPLPDSPGLAARGSLRFVERTSGATSSFAIGGAGDATFAGTLFAGSYDVSFDTASAAGLVGLPPAGSKRVAGALAIGGGAAAPLAYDLAVASVTGTVTLGGGELPTSPTLGNRGSVVFRDRQTGVATSLPVGGSGAGAFAGRLFVSSYDVTFETVASAVLVGLPSAAETRLASALAIGASALAPPPLVWDTRVIALAGRVTLDGAALPDSPALTTRGNLVFRDRLSGDVRALPLAATGAGTASGTAFAGSYDVSLETPASAALVGLPVAAKTNLDTGCLPTPSCEQDPANLTGDWTFIFRDQASWVRWNVSLVQTGDGLGGRFTAATGYLGQFDSGTRTGDTIALTSTQNTATCALRVDATLSGGCLMTGLAACASGQSSFVQSTFVGVR